MTHKRRRGDEEAPAGYDPGRPDDDTLERAEMFGPRYDLVPTAVNAARRWDGEGEPEGWVRHPVSGRRRPGGDPGQEYVWR
jgi:hypothetical protein